MRTRFFDQKVLEKSLDGICTSALAMRSETTNITIIFLSILWERPRLCRGARFGFDSKAQFYRTVCFRATFSRFAGFRSLIFACYYLLSTSNTDPRVGPPTLYQTFIKILGLGEICALKAAIKNLQPCADNILVFS